MGEEQDRESFGPPIPGDWQPTPIHEKPGPEDMGVLSFDVPKGTIFEPHDVLTPDVQEVQAVQRLAYPDLQAATDEAALRRSEAGLVGVIDASSENPESVGDLEFEGTGGVAVAPKIESPPSLTSAELQSPASPSVRTNSTTGRSGIFDATVGKPPSTDGAPSGIRKSLSIGHAKTAKDPKLSVRSRLRDKLRRIGTPQASRVEDKRLSTN